MTPITVRGDVDKRAVEQLRRCAEAGDAVRAALCADGHVGYSQPIGGVVAYPEHVSPSGVGYDIACGNKAVRTDVRYNEINAIVGDLMDEIFERISFGVGRKNNEPVDHPVLDSIRDANFHGQRALLDMAAQQLGTVGSGNHYVDLFAGDDGYVWVGVHFGSRGFGHKTASGFLALAEGKRFEEHATEGEMDSPPVLFHQDSELGQAYVEAMGLAGDYAYAGRDVVVDKVLEILGAEATFEVHNHHNFAWREVIDGQLCWVVRKGCTPARPGQLGFVGATMGEDSVILQGVSSDAGPELLHSTVHGAGRVMSRTKAAGKLRKRWVSNVRDDETLYESEDAARAAGATRPKRVKVRVDGAIDWPLAQAWLRTQGIELRGAGADEAPGAYKRLDEVLGWHADTIDVLYTLRPVGVAMAPANTFDPYKD